MTVVISTLDESVVGEAAHGEPHPVEWWYVNALLEAPGAPVDGMALIVAFSKFDGVIEEARHVLVSREGGTFADFGTGPLPAGGIQASSDRLDIRAGSSRLHGAYPDYQLHLQGEATSGAFVSVDLTYTADIAPEREGYVDEQMKHWVLYRLKVSGTVSLGGVDYPVTGLGYIEHLYGTLGWLEPYLGELNPPTFVNGWNWYWSPAAGPKGVAVQAGGIITRGEPLPLVSVSADGQTFAHFNDGRFEVLQKRTFEGVDYVHQFRLTDSNEHGGVDLTFTRAEAAQRVVKTAPGGNKVIFVSGFARLDGNAWVDGVEYDVSGPAFGSAFTVAFTDRMVRFRSLPPVIRVPMGRVLRLVRAVVARVRKP